MPRVASGGRAIDTVAKHVCQTNRWFNQRIERFLARDASLSATDIHSSQIVSLVICLKTVKHIVKVYRHPALSAILHCDAKNCTVLQSLAVCSNCVRPRYVLIIFW